MSVCRFVLMCKILPGGSFRDPTNLMGAQPMVQDDSDRAVFGLTFFVCLGVRSIIGIQLQMTQTV